MKVRVDFVTNSSSESFGVVIVDTAKTVAAAGGALVMIEAAKSQLDNLRKAAEEIARETAESAEVQEEFVKHSLNTAKSDIDQEIDSLQQEMDELASAWEESSKTADPTDPRSAELAKQVEDYQEYLKHQIATKEAQKYEIAKEAAEHQAAIEAKDEWVKQRQVDMVAVKEERSMLEATLKGYKNSGYDVKDVESRLEQVKAREFRLTKELKEHGGEFDYTPMDRKPIGPNPDLMRLHESYKKEVAKLEDMKIKADIRRWEDYDRRMAEMQKDYQRYIDRSNAWDKRLQYAEKVQYGADVMVEGLSHVTGPAGQQIKLAYKAGKQLGSGVGNAMADPNNAGKHLAKGTIGAVTEVVKDKVGGDSPFKASLANTINEGVQGGLDAAIAGKDVLEGTVGGLQKGAVDAFVDAKLDQAKKFVPVCKGSSVDIHDYGLMKIAKNNPLAKGVVRTVVRENVMDQTKEKLKGDIVGSIFGKGD